MPPERMLPELTWEHKGSRLAGFTVALEYSLRVAGSKGGIAP
jgi:hypothetical protein